MEIYINTDVDGICFPEKYVWQSSYYDLCNPLPAGYFKESVTVHDLFENEYFNDFDSLQAYMEQITGRIFPDIESMNAYLREMCELYDPQSCSIKIYEFARE